MNIHTLHNLQEAYNDVYQLNELSIALKRSAADASVGKVKRAQERFETERTSATAGYLGDILNRAVSQHKRLVAAAYPTPQRKRATATKKKKTELEKIYSQEQVDLYNIILSHLLDEGYADCLGSAEIILENMSDEWLDDILEGFVDPESDDTPSGRRPIDTVAEHPRKKTREKAMKGFVKQMNRNYTGGKFKAKVKDPAED